MSPLKNQHVKDRRESKKSSRKKHVESMFLTNKNKNYNFYYKDKSLFTKIENNKNKLACPKRLFSIRVLESGYVTIEPLKALMRIFK
jgi:hypothetical protein